jgi:HSP20 family molecular chaperone IbpA
VVAHLPIASLGEFVMTTIDLSPLYRSSIGFDRMGSLLDNALRSQKATVGFPPYDIEATGDDRYAITLAVAGFEESELDIQVEKGELRVRGKKADDSEEKSYLARKSPTCIAASPTAASSASSTLPTISKSAAQT